MIIKELNKNATYKKVYIYKSNIHEGMWRMDMIIKNIGYVLFSGNSVKDCINQYREFKKKKNSNK